MKPTLSIGDFLIIAAIVAVLLAIGFAVVSYKSTTTEDSEGNQTTRMLPTIGKGGVDKSNASPSTGN